MTADTFLVIYTDIDGTRYPTSKPMTLETALGSFGDLVNPALPDGARVAVMSEHEWRKVRPLGGAG